MSKMTYSEVLHSIIYLIYLVKDLFVFQAKVRKAKCNGCKFFFLAPSPFHLRIFCKFEPPTVGINFSEIPNVLFSINVLPKSKKFSSVILALPRWCYERFLNHGLKCTGGSTLQNIRRWKGEGARKKILHPLNFALRTFAPFSGI